MATAQPQIAEPAGMGRKIGPGLGTVLLTYFVYMYYFQIMISAFPKIAADLDGMTLFRPSVYRWRRPLRVIFIIGAIAMVLTFLIIRTIPQISIETKSD